VETVFRSESVEIIFVTTALEFQTRTAFLNRSSPPKPVGKGTGLGLSICYGIVHAHLGEVLCQNNTTAEGCTFLVRLPAAALRKQATSSDMNT